MGATVGLSGSYAAGNFGSCTGDGTQPVDPRSVDSDNPPAGGPGGAGPGPNIQTSAGPGGSANLTFQANGNPGSFNAGLSVNWAANPPSPQDVSSAVGGAFGGNGGVAEKYSKSHNCPLVQVIGAIATAVGAFFNALAGGKPPQGTDPNDPLPGLQNAVLNAWQGVTGKPLSPEEKTQVSDATAALYNNLVARKTGVAGVMQKGETPNNGLMSGFSVNMSFSQATGLASQIGTAELGKKPTLPK